MIAILQSNVKSFTQNHKFPLVPHKGFFFYCDIFTTNLRNHRLFLTIFQSFQQMPL